MRKLVLSLLVAILFASCAEKPSIAKTELATVCNPMNLSYRFRPDGESRREAADPTVIEFKGEYYLFASKSGGYWHSKDLAQWTFVLSNEIPVEDYAPTAIVLRDTIFMAISSKGNNKVYKSADPKSGKWLAVDDLDFPVEDPCFYQDTDEKLYLYWGCSNVKPLYVSEIDVNTFNVIGETKEVLNQNPAEYGWEVRGDYNTEYENAPWLEGCWMNKHNGKYYLQYSAPGTREKSYADGVYVADHPMGPFALAEHNPFAYKPEGFACGAGHGSTIEDAYGNFWHLGTISISVKHKFERRVGFYPAFWDEDGIMYSTTKYGDYPIAIPNKKIKSFEDIFPGWMLLSYNKKVSVSSTLDAYQASNINDENIRTYWAAATGDGSEWASIDLGEQYDVYAIQMNFAEQNTNLFGRLAGLRHQYVIEASNNNKDWAVLVDKSKNDNDNSHDYIQLSEKVSYRYLRVINIQVPDGSFAISGFRVFGKGSGAKPSAVKSLTVLRKKDRRAVDLSWNKSEHATGYNISYGNAKDKLYHNYLVYGDTAVTIRSLNSNQEYFFTIEAFNENGIVKSEALISRAE
ncbi:family 43 glycosylhydrolase [Labilibaculum sp. DW002]|uniref:Family 43 glycosylhydrolase n=1 Tax=Paralabilibaculum antarcticum TaxID=2912572 RepID=A0ABT5VRE0_9BACT|nr:family 43 glycosylhydrolase [Labilibaculum sp. DW002]MDE5417088.1 family 43 glycosylhydrolase [Labilibaculum sp. DW002]